MTGDIDARSLEGFPAADVVATGAVVARAYDRLAEELQPVVVAEDCVMLGILMGGLLPLARLSGIVTGDFTMDYCQVGRYRGATQGGEFEWVQAPRSDLGDRTVLLIDDIFDEGITLDYVVRACLDRGAHRVLSIVLVRKRHDRVAVDYEPDLVGLEVDDRYVFGCGMDYRHRWRHLPAIYALRGES